MLTTKSNTLLSIFSVGLGVRLTFYRNQCSERLSNLPKVTQVVSGRAEMWIKNYVTPEAYTQEKYF